MKKPLLFIITPLLLISCFLSIYVYAAEFIDKSDPKHIDKILATDLSTISKELFYQCEFAIMSGFSGSGGYSLDEPLIEWLRRAENVFKSRGIKIKDEYNRHFAFADSYFNHEMYEKALEEFVALFGRELLIEVGKLLRGDWPELQRSPTSRLAKVFSAPVLTHDNNGALGVVNEVLGHRAQ